MKKNGKLKILLIIVLTMLIIYTIIVLIRWNILNNIAKKNRQYAEKNNYSITYELEDKSNNVYKRKYSRRNDIYKVQVITSNIENTFWYNESTGEKYRYIENEKYYEVSENAESETLPDNVYDLNFPIEKNETFKRLIYSMNLTNYIYITLYEGKKCYVLENNSEIKKEYIDKDTGLCVLKNFKGEITSLVNGELKKEEHEGNYKINYTFDVITDSEIEKPDFNEYHTR